MSENVKNVGKIISTNGKMGSDLITVPREEFEKLKYKCEEYRNIIFDLEAIIRNAQGMNGNIEGVLKGEEESSSPSNHTGDGLK